MKRFQQLLINTSLVLCVMCLALGFMILIDKYQETHNKANAAYQDMKAAEYRALTEQYKSETARLTYECAEAKLNAFLKIYGGQ